MNIVVSRQAARADVDRVSLDVQEVECTLGNKHVVVRESQDGKCLIVVIDEGAEVRIEPRSSSVWLVVK